MFSETTKLLNRAMWRWAMSRSWCFICPEVTIGFGGHERVDFMIMDGNGTFRCFEVKSSLADFTSGCKHSFVGNFNYYVMPESLYEKVKERIPTHVGVMVYCELGCTLQCAKSPVKCDLPISAGVLKDSMIRSLFRELRKSRTKNLVLESRLSRMSSPKPEKQDWS